MSEGESADYWDAFLILFALGVGLTVIGFIVILICRCRKKTTTSLRQKILEDIGYRRNNPARLSILGHPPNAPIANLRYSTAFSWRASSGWNSRNLSFNSRQLTGQRLNTPSIVITTQQSEEEIDVDNAAIRTSLLCVPQTEDHMTCLIEEDEELSNWDDTKANNQAKSVVKNI